MTTPVFHAASGPAPEVEEDDFEDGARPRPSGLDPHFFRRERNGGVKLRINLSPEEATLIEEAADGTPLMLYIHRVLIERAKFHIDRSTRTGSGRVSHTIDEEP